MEKEILYLYLGTNGTILSPVHLEGAYYTRRLKLYADKNKLLTNGKETAKIITIPEEDLSKWYEIDDNKGQN